MWLSFNFEAYMFSRRTSLGSGVPSGGILGFETVLSVPMSLFSGAGFWWAALAALVTFVLSARLAFAIPLVLDRGMTLLSAMRTSWHALQGQWLRSIGFMILCALACLSGMLLCGVGIVFTLPLGYLPIVVLYRRFFQDSSGSSPVPDSDFRAF